MTLRAFLLVVLAALPGATLAQLGTPPPTRPVALYAHKLVPTEEFWIAYPEIAFCPFMHYHAASGGAVTAPTFWR